MELIAAKSATITGQLLIPLDPTQNFTLFQLLSPPPQLFRSVLHQGELALMYLVVTIPPAAIPQNFTTQMLLDSIDLRPTLNYTPVRCPLLTLGPG